MLLLVVESHDGLEAQISAVKSLTYFVNFVHRASVELCRFLYYDLVIDIQ